MSYTPNTGFPVQVGDKTVKIVRKATDDASRPTLSEVLYDADDNAYVSTGPGTAKRVEDEEAAAPVAEAPAEEAAVEAAPEVEAEEDQAISA